jgi:hypothetical protein
LASSFLVRCLARPKTSPKFAREMWADHEQPRQVQLARGDSVEQFRKFSDHPGRSDAPHGFVFRQSQFVDAVCAQARACPRPVQSARFDLAQVCEQRRKYLVRAPNQRACTREQLHVRKLRYPDATVGHAPLYTSNFMARR